MLGYILFATFCITLTTIVATLTYWTLTNFDIAIQRKYQTPKTSIQPEGQRLRNPFKPKPPQKTMSGNPFRADNKKENRRFTQNISKEDFHKELTEKLQGLAGLQSTMDTSQMNRSRNQPGSLSSSTRKMYAEYEETPSQTEKSASQIVSNLQSSKKQKSKTFDNSGQWKKEVEIGSLLSSSSSYDTAFGRLIDEYSNINDSGIKISCTSSNLSYDSERRKQKFLREQKKGPALWAKPEYIQAICRLQKAYSRHNFFGEKDNLLNPDMSKSKEHLDHIMKDLAETSNSLKK
ncbi:unnamed protein product [Moneuplotes crassus]|uniref:Uncharacterized protein n=1 Tax=Euplotes crassus TaxID=5936 RepID=A0AAD2D0Q6_EUPCR|nr:unnamed protein product [Moneuplotes crassus]